MTKHLIKFHRGDKAPLNPAIGTVWFDNTVGSEIIKLWTGSKWEIFGATAADLLALKETILGKDILATDLQTLAAINEELRNLADAIENVVFETITYSTRKLTEDEVKALGENVKEAYRLTQTQNTIVTEEEEGQMVEKVVPVTTDVTGAQDILIYKDASLISVELVSERPAEGEEGKEGYVPAKAGQFIKYTYILANGEVQTVYVDVSEIIVETECGNGLEKSDAGVISVQIDTASTKDRNNNAYLSVSANGVKLDLSELHKVIEENELVTAAALHDLNTRVTDLEDTLDEFGVSGDADSFSVVEGSVEEGYTVKNTLAKDVAATEYPANTEYTSPDASGLATDKYVQDYVASVFGWEGWSDPTPVVEEGEGEGEGA